MRRADPDGHDLGVVVDLLRQLQPRLSRRVDGVDQGFSKGTQCANDFTSHSEF